MTPDLVNLLCLAAGVLLGAAPAVLWPHVAASLPVETEEER